jgi:Na+/melibiose symporter-like transporter
MGIFCVLAVIFFLITFLTTKERIQPAARQQTPLKQDILDLLRNRPWLIMFLVFVMMFIFLGIRNSILLYFFKYYLDKTSMLSFLEVLNKGLFGLIDRIGMIGPDADIAGNTFSIINILSQLVTIIGLTVSRPLANRFGKRDVFRYGLILCVLFSASFIFISPGAVVLTLILQLLFQFMWGVAAMSLPWAMMADVADFSEWKTNRRATAITFAGIIIGLKVGLAVGGAMAGSLLNIYGYVANVAQTSHTQFGIRMITSVWPAVFLAIGIILLFFYQINKSAETQMQNELAERRNALTQK